jgi:hypothetical protein
MDCRSTVGSSLSTFARCQEVRADRGGEIGDLVHLGMRHNPAQHNDSALAVLGHLFQTFAHLPGLIRLAISWPLSRHTPTGETVASLMNILTGIWR